MFLSQVKTRDPEIPTSSLPDIVFLLLIFFLVVSSIDFEKSLSLVLPDNSGVLPVDPDNLINLLINSSGEIALDGRQIETAEITSLIKARLEDHPNLIVSFKTSQNTKYEMYIDILDRLKQSWGERPTRISIVEPE